MLFIKKGYIFVRIFETAVVKAVNLRTLVDADTTDDKTPCYHIVIIWRGRDNGTAEYTPVIVNALEEL